MELSEYENISRLEDRHWWYVGMRTIAADLIRTLDLPPSAHILDAGCGVGGGLKWLSAFGAVTGIDLHPLAARYAALERLPLGSFGRAFWEIYRNNGYAFPGEERAVNVRFATPHDSTHVVSGYDTSPRGEILVSTFTAGMHPVRPMEGHILPVIYSWHLNIKINDLAGSAKGQFDPDRFWIAWTRGAQTTVDIFAPDWEFWSVVEEPVDVVRRRCHVPKDDVTA